MLKEFQHLVTDVDIMLMRYQHLSSSVDFTAAWFQHRVPNVDIDKMQTPILVRVSVSASVLCLLTKKKHRTIAVQCPV